MINYFLSLERKTIIQRIILYKKMRGRGTKDESAYLENGDKAKPDYIHFLRLMRNKYGRFYSNKGI